MSEQPEPEGAMVPDEIAEFLEAAGLFEAGGAPFWAPLTGGVASDIWHVRTGTRHLVVKRALAKLRVAQDWTVPTARNASEVAWLRKAQEIVPDGAPRVLAHDPVLGLFAMEYLDPERHPVWKSLLQSGQVDDETARAVGAQMATIHAATAGDAAVAEQFRNDTLFHDIRLAPYLEATAKRHLDLAEHLLSLSRETLATHVALVHGDMSPKNILIGPQRPVFLDAECAWYGDPAFDLAFCLNHLLLKCLRAPSSAQALLRAFDALSDSYLRQVGWEPPEALERRAARLLPGLFLARIDGKSPVEYVTHDAQRDQVRRTAGRLLANPSKNLAGVREAWAKEIFE